MRGSCGVGVVNVEGVIIQDVLFQGNTAVKVSGSIPLSFVEFPCSPRVCVGSLWVLQLPPKSCDDCCDVSEPSQKCLFFFFNFRFCGVTTLNFLSLNIFVGLPAPHPPPLR